eukprot:1148164-Pelagomonas_calceolata.AAC.6
MNGFVGGRKSSKGDSSKLWDVFSLVACTLIMVRGSVQGGCFLYQHLRASDMGVLLRDLSKGWRSICLVAAVLVQLNMQAPGIKTSQGTIKQALHECVCVWAVSGNSLSGITASHGQFLGATCVVLAVLGLLASSFPLLLPSNTPVLGGFSSSQPGSAAKQWASRCSLPMRVALLVGLGLTALGSILLLDQVSMLTGKKGKLCRQRNFSRHRSRKMRHIGSKGP